MAPLIACAALVLGLTNLARAALWITAAGAIISPILLVMDLGRPQLFLNMLRVFKHRSPMSVGAWILFIFGAFAVPAWLVFELYVNEAFAPSVNPLVLVVAGLLTLGAAISGLGLATYTGVLIGATAIPAWFLHRVLLPIHFGTAGLGCAAAILELAGFQIRPLYLLGLLVAIIETLLWTWLEFDKHGAADCALHEGRAGRLIRLGEILCGPLPIILRLTNLFRWPRSPSSLARSRVVLAGSMPAGLQGRIQKRSSLPNAPNEESGDLPAVSSAQDDRVVRGAERECGACSQSPGAVRSRLRFFRRADDARSSFAFARSPRRS